MLFFEISIFEETIGEDGEEGEVKVFSKFFIANEDEDNRREAIETTISQFRQRKRYKKRLNYVIDCKERFFPIVSNLIH